MKKNFLFFFYFILSLFLIIGGNEARQTKANFLSKTAFSPFINSVNYFRSLFEIKQKNQMLAAQLALQTQKIANLENTIQEINNSKIVYDEENYSFVLADIVGFSGLFLERNLIVNKGLVNDVLVNSPVVSNKGVVGKVISASLNYSIILPLNNPLFKLSVMCKRSKLQGIMETDIYGNSYVNLIKLGSNIAVGDTIITSNVSPIFPKGYPVGIVTQLKESPDQVYMNAKLNTFVNPASLDQVIILQYVKDLKYEREFEIN